MSQRSALVLGASGLVGQELLKMLLSNSLYNHVTVFVRKSYQSNTQSYVSLKLIFQSLISTKNALQLMMYIAV